MRVDVRAEKCELRVEKSSKYIIPGPSLCGILSPKDFRGLRPCQQPGIPTGASTWDCLARVLPGRDCLFSVGLGFLVLFTRLCQTSLEPPHRGWWHPAAESAHRKWTQHRLLLSDGGFVADRIPFRWTQVPCRLSFK